MNRIRQLREEREWTQDDLGSLLNVKRPAISKYENESVPLTADTLKLLSGIFDVSVDYILGITNERGGKQKTSNINIPQSKRSLIEDLCNADDETTKELEQYLNYLKSKKEQAATGTEK